MGLFPRDRNLSRAPREVRLEVRASDFQLSPEEVEIRLDAFLKLRLPWRSRTSVQRLVQEGFVLVAPAGPDRAPTDEAPVVERRSARVLRNGARVVVVIPPELRLPDVLAQPGDLVILYEDGDALAVDKPAGQPVHPSGRHLSGTLIQEVHARYAQGDLLPAPVQLCHRIDRETSGVVLLAKGQRAQRRIRRQFDRRTIEKEYLAIVHGLPEREEGTIELPLGPAHKSSVRMKITVQEGGWEARTHWKLLERRGNVALLSCTPVTGRQHQIRVHLAAIGLPIVGDKLYGEDEDLFLKNARQALEPRDLETLRLPRHALHSHRLTWLSPTTGDPRTASSPLPRDLRDFLDTFDDQPQTK